MKKNILTLAISAVLVTNLAGCDSSNDESVESRSGLDILAQEHVSLDVNSTLQLELAEGDKSSERATWRSTDTSVAKVIDGLVVPVSLGQTTIVATIEGQTDHVDITVADIDSKTNEADEDKLEQWTLIKEYTFDDNTDLNDWYFEEGNEPEYFLPRADGTLRNPGWGNQEQQYFTKSGNAEISDGNLVITAKVQTSPPDRDGNTFDYTSARMISKGGFEFEKGRLEIRAKMPEGPGLWPALWLLGANFSDLPDGLRSATPEQWPDCGEIDLMEMVGQNTREIKGTIHAPQSFAATGVGTAYHLDENTPSFSEDFHTYTLEWDDDEIEWYIDGNLYHVVNKHELIDMGREASWVFDKEFFLIMNVSVGGTMAGDPIPSQWVKPTMEVDYVKVYQDSDNRTLPEGEEIWDTDNERRNEFVPEIEFSFANGDFAEQGYWGALAKNGSFNISNGAGEFNVKAFEGQPTPLGSYIYAFQGPYKITEGSTYRVTLDAKASLDRDITVYIGDGQFSPMLDESYQPTETMGVFSVNEEYQT
ncbi:TPA: family 16 glycosylhydrolase, partial [Vibrio parahaemolyticus]